MEIKNDHHQQRQLSSTNNIQGPTTIYESINQSLIMVPSKETATNNNIDLRSSSNQQPSDDFEDDEHSLPIPELIEMLKNLAACNEKLYKWEQSTVKLEQIPADDPNKRQLNEIINFVNLKTSTREKAIYLYQQLGRKCSQHGNYIGAAKAFERAASLLMDPTDQSEMNNADDKTIMETIQCLESAIHNYDAIHKYKHAGTLHYRCSRILRLLSDFSREQVEQHHIKALEYFTKPDHELKQRKRIDGLKISCYSSSSTWARMISSSNTRMMKTKNKNNTMTTTHHKTITTTNHHLIKFLHHHDDDEDYADEEDDDDDELVTLVESDVENDNHLVNHRYSNDGSDHSKRRKTLAKMNNDNNIPSSSIHTNSGLSLSSSSSLSKIFQSTSPKSTSFDFNPINESTAKPTLENFLDQHLSQNQLENRRQDADGEDAPIPSAMIFNESLPSTPTTPSSLASRDSIPSLPVGGGQQQRQRQRSVSPTRKYHKENHSHRSESIYKQQKHHNLETTSQKYLHRHSRHHRSYSSYHHNSSKSLSNHQPVFRCIEDRIESAKKLVKKLHKLCPFYDVTTTGIDAGRVYCRICDRYLGAVSSTLKNHVNTQEHRQAFEDSHQQQQYGTTLATTTDGIATPQLTFAATSTTSNSQSQTLPMVTYPAANNGQNVGQIGNYVPVNTNIINRSLQCSNIIANQQQQHPPLASTINQIQWHKQPTDQHSDTTNSNRESEYQAQQQLYRSSAATVVVNPSGNVQPQSLPFSATTAVPTSTTAMQLNHQHLQSYNPFNHQQQFNSQQQSNQYSTSSNIVSIMSAPTTIQQQSNDRPLSVAFQ
ncbi:hypothetical protein DERF_008841 [Dermatophagoides farinae]|uniref:Uncharacterized protein n=1 Tax=Dermatophagoides farinae TaxID=6954 RepID=A0A922I381_DERFA|nr:hypothetical protein DERF_008841 [Dermatophagoides farinae]